MLDDQRSLPRDTDTHSRYSREEGYAGRRWGDDDLRASGRAFGTSGAGDARRDMGRLQDNLCATQGLLKELRALSGDVSESTTVWLGKGQRRGGARTELAGLMEEYVLQEPPRGGAAEHEGVLAQYDKWQVWVAGRVREVAELQHQQRSASIAVSTMKQQARRLLPEFNRLRCSTAALQHTAAARSGSDAAPPRLPAALAPADLEDGGGLPRLLSEQCDAIDAAAGDIARRAPPSDAGADDVHALSDAVSRLQSALLLACGGRNHGLLLAADRRSPPRGSSRSSVAAEGGRVERLLEYVEETALRDGALGAQGDKDAKDTLDKLRATIRDQEAELDDAAERDRTFRRRIGELERAAADAGGTPPPPPRPEDGAATAALQEQVDAAGRREREMEALAEGFKQEAEALTERVAALEAEKEQMEATARDDLASGVDDLYDEISVLKEKLETAEQKLGSRSSEDGLHREVAALSQELQDTRGELAQAQDAAKDEAAAAEQLYEELLELRQGRGDRKACAAQTEESGNISDEYERILAGVAVNEQELQAELKDALERLDEREQELQDAYDKLAQAEDEKAALRDRVALLEAALRRQQAASPSHHSSPAQHTEPEHPPTLKEPAKQQPRSAPVKRKGGNSKFPYLGLTLGALRSEIGGHGGLRVVDVSGPALAAGLQENDVITEVEGVPVNEQEDLKKVLEGFRPTEAVYMKLIRDGLLYEVDVLPVESEIAPGQGARYTAKVLVKPKQNLFQIARSPPPSGRESGSHRPPAARADRALIPHQQARDLAEQSNAIFRKHTPAPGGAPPPPATTRSLRY
eukprot:TRINITY_DN499_c1_g1_i2.p1 TRINITY_DN499_c1_g1~~TRINITY_DN499_c1_g1_i2.p1  ORF type:complete len:844 (+),score=334.57 TRINITY_DN499_c1_g1_i2:97-2532(+)